jgi:hypothetical protein
LTSLGPVDFLPPLIKKIKRRKKERKETTRNRKNKI